MSFEGFSLESMVAGVIKEAQYKVAQEATEDHPGKSCDEAHPEKSHDEWKASKKEAPAAPAEAAPPTADEAEKTASAIDYIASCIEGGHLTGPDPTDLEKISEAYQIVAAVEADPRLKFKIASAMEHTPPVEPGETKGISPGAAPGALANDRNAVPGGGGTQGVSTAAAPKESIPPKDPGETQGVGPNPASGAMKTDVDSPPGGGEAYPEDGAIRGPAIKAAFAMGSALRKRAAEDTVATASASADAAPIGNPEGAAPAGENVPAAAQPPQIQSNEKAEDYTKGDAKAKEKKELSAVLDTPALSSAHDNTLDNALSHAEDAGAKLASMARRELVERVLSGEVEPGQIKTAAASAGKAFNPSDRLVLEARREAGVGAFGSPFGRK